MAGRRLEGARSAAIGPDMSKPPFDFYDLDAYLSSERSPEDCLQLSDLDGLLTAVAVSPSAIPAEEWLAVVWGGAVPVFRSAREKQQVTGAILDRYHEIVAGLQLLLPAVRTRASLARISIVIQSGIPAGQICSLPVIRFIPGRISTPARPSMALDHRVVM